MLRLKGCITSLRLPLYHSLIAPQVRGVDSRQKKTTNDFFTGVV